MHNQATTCERVQINGVESMNASRIDLQQDIAAGATVRGKVILLRNIYTIEKKEVRT